MSKKGFSCVQFMLSLFIMTSPIILLQNYYAAYSASLSVNFIALAIGLVISLIYFMPSFIIKKRTGLDFPSFALRATPTAIIFTATFYAIYFIYIIEYFLLKYIDVFQTSINPGANSFVVAGLMLLAAVYAACKGGQGITRCGIFIFVFAIICFALFFGGNAFDLNFSAEVFNISDSLGDLTKCISSAMTFSFVAVVFASFCGQSKNCKLRHIIITMSAVILLSLAAMLFIWFVLGEYGKQQNCHMYLLSKSVHFEFTNGIDSLFLALITFSVFMVLSFALICICRAFGNYKRVSMTSLFAVIAFILYICAENFKSINSVLLSSNIFNALTFAAAVLIPVIYIFMFGNKMKNLNARL